MKNSLILFEKEDFHDWEVEEIKFAFPNLNFVLRSETEEFKTIEFRNLSALEIGFFVPQAVINNIYYQIMSESETKEICDRFTNIYLFNNKLEKKYYYNIEFSTNCKFLCISDIISVKNC